MALNFRVVSAGLRALLIEVDGLAQVHGLAAWLRQQSIAGELEEIVPAPRSVLVEGPPPVLVELERLLPRAPEVTVIHSTGITHVVDIVYDGPDLPEICGRLHISEEEFVRRHSAQRYSVAYFGFSPGHPYFAPIPEELRVGRRPAPRSRIPPNSLAMANEFNFIYPGGTPGGWSLIGTAVGAPLWSLEQDPPNLVDLGDDVIFNPVHA